MRALNLKVLRDIWVHRGQYLALIVLVSIGITSYVAFRTSYFDLSASLQASYARLALSDFDVRVVRAPLSAAHEVSRLPGVAAASVRVVRDVGIDLADGRQATARVISCEPGSSANRVTAVIGRLYGPEATGEAVIDPRFASDAGLKIGDRITLRVSGRRVTTRLVGIATDPQYLYPVRAEGDFPSPGEFAVVWVSQPEAQRLLGGHGWGNDVAVRLAPGARLSTTIDRVEAELGDYGVTGTTKRADNPGYAGMSSEVDQNRIMAETMPALILAISTMSLFIALSRLVQSQRGQIGLAKALGYSDWQLVAHYLAFAGVIALGGTLLGVALGVLGARGIAQSYVSLLRLPFLENGFYPSVVAVGAFMAIASCAAAATVPALASARLAPAVAMYSDPNVALSGGRIPLVERLLGRLMPESFVLRIPLRNVFRARRRSIYTVIGIAFALVMTVATVSMFDSMDYMVGVTFGQTERWDVSAFFETPLSLGELDEIRHLDGVTRTWPALVVPVTLRASSGAEKSVALTAMNPSATFHGFDVREGAPPEITLASGGLVVPQGTARDLGLTVGSRVIVDSPFADEPVALRVGTITDEMLGQPTYVSLAGASAVIGRAVNEYNAVYLLTDGTRDKRIQDELFDLPGAASVLVKSGLIARIKAMLELFSYFGTVILGFGFAMAFVVIYTTFSANVTERTREIATMRTIGEDNGRLTAMITLENFALAIAAIPLGVWLGVIAAQAVFERFASDQYRMDAIIYPASVARITLLMLAVMLLSEIPPVRRIFRLDLAAATKVME